MCLFRSEEELEDWIASHPTRERGGTMTVDTCWKLARIWYADKLKPGYRRKTPDEVRAAFESLGLVGDFWRLG